MTRKIRQEINCSEYDFISVFIDIYSILFVPTKNYLNKTEKKHLVHLIVLYRRGYELFSRECNRELKRIFSFSEKNRGIWIYRKKLEKKGWIIKKEEGLDLLPALKGNFDISEFSIKLNGLRE